MKSSFYRTEAGKKVLIPKSFRKYLNKYRKRRKRDSLTKIKAERRFLYAELPF